MRKFGVVGKSLGHSFSPGYFAHKFKLQDIKDAAYQAYELESITELPSLLSRENLKGVNITVPFKEDVLDILDVIDPQAEFVGAVNTVKVVEGKLHGYNTDVFGFGESLVSRFLPHNFEDDALILGTGGASKAISYVLTELIIPHKFVSTSGKGDLSYEDLDANLFKNHLLIINTTPLGMHPDVESCPQIPYDLLTEKHLAFDLVYNPEETAFLSNAKAKGARIKNGMEMLTLQAEASWAIWNE